MGYREKCLQEKGDDCSICGAEENVVVHHVDGDRSNNDLDNLLPVCRTCHSRIHTDSDGLQEWSEKLLPFEQREETAPTSLKLPEYRKELIEQARDIVADNYDPDDDPPTSKVIEAALRHLVQSHANVQDARGDVDPSTIKRLANTDVLQLRYRTSIESRWRN